MAQIVVPWVSTKPVLPWAGRSLGLKGWWPRRRSRSTKLGPGSSPGVNMGRVMWPGRLPPCDELHDPTPGQGVHLSRARLVVDDGDHRLLQEVAVLLELAQAVVASQAQQTTDFPGLVVVVDVERLPVLGRVLTDGAYAALLHQ